MKGGDTREKIMGEHEAIHPNGQTTKEVIVVQEETQELFAQTKLTMYATTIRVSLSIKFVTTIAIVTTSQNEGDNGHT
jgi:hypothetical protein